MKRISFQKWTGISKNRRRNSSRKTLSSKIVQVMILLEKRAMRAKILI
jgi:hypothetical protein